MVPYNRDIADQRRKYGDNMLRKGDEHMTAQRQYEAESQAKLDAARQRRQEEKERLEALEVCFIHFSSLTTVAQFPHGLYIPEYILSKLIAV